MPASIEHSVSMHMLVLIGCAAAFGADLNITVTSGGSGTVTVCPGAEVGYQVIGELTDANNEGLAGFVFDLSLDGEPLPPAETPTADPMIRFAIPNGFTNPAGYGGTVVADCLVQVGGAQNTINNPGPEPPYPSGDVLTGVAHTVVELVTGSLTAPVLPGAYTLSVSNVVATVIKQGETGVPFWATEVAGTGAITNLTIVVGFASSPPQAEMILDAQKQLHVSTKNRFLSFAAGDAGQSQAIRVTLADLPPPYHEFNGNTMWVGEPFEVTEKAGAVDPHVPGFDDFWAAKLQCEPYFSADWSTFGTVHVFSAFIVPDGTYRIQVVNQACDLAEESGYSEPLVLTTSKWGDVCASFAQGPNNDGQWGPPDGTADMTSDVLAVLRKSINKRGLIKARADLGPGLTAPNPEPDLTIDITRDILYAVQAKEVLTRYTALTGRPALPPAWSFGLWLTTSFTTNYDEDTVTGFIQGMADRDLPLHVFHFDCFWMKEFHWCNFEWDSRVFSNPKAMLKRLKSRGLHICVWINPYIAQRSALFDEGMQQGYLLKKPNGDVWQWDMWQAGMGIVDFTNPEACRWFRDKLLALVEMGVDCFKTDFGERIPTEVVYFDGSDPIKMHNYYPYLYNKTVFEMLEDKLGKGGAAVFARSATAGCQQFPVHWGGDSTATFESMAESLRGGLSLCLSGFGFWSHDIGGFEQTASADVYKRWCAFGLLSSHSRLHGSSSYRVPWLFDEEAVDVLRFFTKLKCRLMPYLFGTACEAHKEGVPVMRAMMLEFPGDPGCDCLDRQYMLGDSLLVAPVFSPDGTVDYYLPEGRWTNFLTGQVVEGGRWAHETHDYLSLPLMVRPNSVIPVGANDQQPDYDYANGVTFHVFELQDGSTVSARVPALNGDVAMTIEVNRAGQQVHISVKGASKPWSVLLRGDGSVQSVKGGKAQAEKLGTLLMPEKGARHITVRLPKD